MTSKSPLELALVVLDPVVLVENSSYFKSCLVLNLKAYIPALYMMKHSAQRLNSKLVLGIRCSYPARNIFIFLCLVSRRTAFQTKLKLKGDR